MHFRFVALLLAFDVSVASAADMGMYTFDLSYISADEARHVLAPLLLEDEKLSVHQGSLILRSGPQTRLEANRLLKKIDMPPQALLIRLARADSLVSVQGEDESVELAAIHSVSYQVRANAGEAVFVETESNVRGFRQEANGARRPQLQFAIAPSGFFVEARVRGDQVYVQLSRERVLQESELPPGQAGIDFDYSISGPVGAWLSESRLPDAGPVSVWETSTTSAVYGQAPWRVQVEMLSR